MNCSVVLVLMVGLLGCGDRSPVAGTERGACLEGNKCSGDLECRSGLCVSPATPSEASDDPANLVPSEGPTDEQQVKALFQRWLDSQNDGDFEAYATTFAREFTGVRRSGPKKSNFDLRGWVKDRQRMFKKPMKVAANDLHIDVQPTYAQITFTQTWASGTYKDTGPKQLVAIPIGGSWQIAREDMISSDHRPSYACDPGEEECTGDAEFYANIDWDAYSDDEDGEQYVSQEIARRYRGDIERCRAHADASNRGGQIQGTVIAGGYLKAVNASGFGDAANSCIQRVAGSTWLFADPESNAQNDFAPQSLREGKVPFRITIEPDGSAKRTYGSGPKHRTVGIVGALMAPAMSNSTEWDGPGKLVGRIVSNKAAEMLSLAEPTTAIATYLASKALEGLSQPDIEGTAELVIDGNSVDSILLGLNHDSLTPVWPQAFIRAVDVTKARLRITLIDRDAFQDDHAATIELGPEELEAALSGGGSHSIDVHDQTDGQVLMLQISVL